MQVWATATIAALVAGPGLGQVITEGFYRTNYGQGIAGAIVVAAVALVLEFLAASRAAGLDPLPRPDRSSPKRHRGMSAGRPMVTEVTDSVGREQDPDTRGDAAGHRRTQPCRYDAPWPR